MALGQTLRTERPLFGGHMGCQEEFKPRMYEAPWPMQVWSLVLRAANNLRPARP